MNLRLFTTYENKSPPRNSIPVGLSIFNQFYPNDQALSAAWQLTGFLAKVLARGPGTQSITSLWETVAENDWKHTHASACFCWFQSLSFASRYTLGQHYSIKAGPLTILFINGPLNLDLALLLRLA